MNNKFKSFALSSLTIALMATTGQAIAEEDDSEAIEEVVVKASRLKGTASAVMQERKNQAFVADILGAEQISRTGDSDAAAALRRVTGITLVDGKFIYVRGLRRAFFKHTIKWCCCSESRSYKNGNTVRFISIKYYRITISTKILLGNDAGTFCWR